MARLPVLHKRHRSKREQALDDLARRYAQALTIVKTAPAGARVAVIGAKTYTTTRFSTARKRSKARIIAVPVAVAGGIVVFRKARSRNGDEPDSGRPLGPVASADTVSPPASTTEAAQRAEAEHNAAEGTETAAEHAEAHASS
jgi:hypothetical protein